jgi:hypothetical protein
MCAVLLPPAVNPVAVNKYVKNLNHQLTFGAVDLFAPFKGFFLPSPFSFPKTPI